MKQYEIEEFVTECERIMNDPYGYDRNRMPKGFCNGHLVGYDHGFLSSVIIDCGSENLMKNMLVHCDGEEMSPIEHIRRRLAKPGINTPENAPWWA